jgi:hypothetical protein
MERVNRQRFLKRAGAATGAAAFVGVPGIGKAVTDDEPAKVVAKPGPVTKEPVLVYVRDAARGEVTVMHGTRAMTYRDRALVRRLLKAAKATAESTPWEVG